jgi:large subunit ribosomal protein L21
MYAIIEDGRHQFKVEEGQELDIDYRDLPAGEEVKFDRVLAVRDLDGMKIGRPALEAAVVTAKVLAPVVQGPKLVIQKFRKRKNMRRRTGHRQMYTRVVIERIAVG